MMSREAFFAEHPMFKRAASSFKPSSSDDSLQNIVEFRDDVVYVWSAADGAILAANVNSEDTDYQTLRPIAAAAFPVERLCVAAGGARACAWGARGALVVQLPARVASPRAAHTVLCKSASLDERFLLSQAEVLRVRWHPRSLAHLLVLVSDNTIRLYNVAAKGGARLVRALATGPRPRARLAGRRILESLGDTAVDFDLAPSGELLVLRGNGDVYSVAADVGDDSAIPAQLRGPLAMYPPADDNYGEESCSIAVLGGGDAPALVVVATCSAVLYHCLLLPDSRTEDLNKTEEKPSSDMALYVVESVELSILLSAEETRLQYSYPVHLYPVPGKSDRYACVHAAGVHTVTLPIMSQLKEYVDADNNETESVLARLVSRESVARYLVCTRGPGAGAEFSPPRGLCFLPPSALPGVLLLLQSGEVLSRTLEPCNLEEQLFSGMQTPDPDLSFEHINSLLKEREKMSFSALIQDLLTRGVSQPLLRTSAGGEPSPKEALEFLTQATSKLDEEYMRRQEAAADVMLAKLQDLRSLKRQQLEWFADVQVEADEVTATAAALREKCAYALKKQMEIRERCWRAVRRARGDAPTSPAERALLAELHERRRDADRARAQLDVLRDSLAMRADQLKCWEEEYQRKEMCLGRSHSETINSILQQQSDQISSLIEETKLLKDQLSIA